MKTRIIGLETEFALLHYPADPNRQKILTGTEIFEIVGGAIVFAVLYYTSSYYQCLKQKKQARKSLPGAGLR